MLLLLAGGITGGLAGGCWPRGLRAGVVPPIPAITILRAFHPQERAEPAGCLRMLGGATGVSLCGIVLQWRLSAHGDSLDNPLTSPARLAAFNESFLMLAALCALTLVAVWQLKTNKE